MQHTPNFQVETEEEPEGRNYLTIFLILIPIVEILLFAMAGYHLGFADGGWMGFAKLGIISLGAFLVAYAIYRMAIEKGALLYVQGSVLALVLSFGSVTIVGSSFFIATALGLSNPVAQEGEMTAFMGEVGPYFDGRIAVADQARALAPAMQELANDLAAHTEREGDTGEGPIFRMLESLFGRADGLSQQITLSMGVRRAVLEQITALRAAMEATLADEDRGIADRRAEMRRQNTQLLSLLAELDKAVPVSLVSAYSKELQSGILIPNREDASARINQTLAGYSATLSEALAAQKGVAGDPPAFPAKVGALDSFRYLNRTLPIILVAFIVDLLFPLALLAYSVMTLAQIDRTKRPERWEKPPRRKTDIDRIIDLNSGQIPRSTDNDQALDQSPSAAKAKRQHPRTPRSDPGGLEPA